MKRTQSVWWKKGPAGVLAAASVALLVVIVVVLATSAGGSGGGYKVRAIFDDAANLIPGENVKIDGVPVGRVGTVSPTPDGKAAVTLDIENPGFQDFRRDASCIIRPQALIGEKFVDCLPTQPRSYGAPLPGPLQRISKGEGEGELELPVRNTSSPVDVDQLQDITRLPEAQRLRILLNEFGAGFAGRGSDLREVIRRANPALREFDDVLKILAGENHVLEDLAVESDRALAPIAAQRAQVAGFISQSKVVAVASAKHLGALGQNFADFPAFLRQLSPEMTRLSQFSDQATPTLTDLNAAAPGINKIFKNLGPFSKSGTAFFQSLGNVSKPTGAALEATEPLLGKVEAFGSAALPFSSNFAKLLSSVRSTGGIERLLDLIFLGAGATNGYDALGHFLRAEGVVTPCTTYAIAPAIACSSKFSATAAEARLPGNPETTSLVMERTLAVLEGATPSQAIAEYPGPLPSEESTQSAASGGPSSTVKPVGGAAAGTTYYSPAEESSVSGPLLNYLLGG